MRMHPMAFIFCILFLSVMQGSLKTSLFTDVIQVVTITKEIFVQGQIADDLSLALKIYIPTLTKYFVILKVMKYFWSVN